MTSQEEAVDPALASETQTEGEPFLHSATSSTPWWVVSVLFHVLVIALAGLVSMAITLPNSDDSVVVFTDIFKPPELQHTEPQPKPDDPKVLSGEVTVKGTDQTSSETAKINISEEIERLAIKGDHFETVNNDLPDTHSARGVQESTSFMLVRGSIDDPGGGGNNGQGFSDFIGVGGDGSAGDGGGSGGGHGTGFGTDKGAGTGSFGRPTGSGRILMIKKFHGTKATDDSVLAALRWLAYHQEADGHWDTQKYGSGQKTDTAMTGMALLAFLGAGHTEKSGEYRENVKRAVAWIKSKQQASGLIYDQTDAGAHRGIGYPTAIATMGLVEAAGMANIPDTRAAAQKAIDYCIQHQCGEGSDKLGWRYNPKQPGDTSVTGWFVMALKSAKVAGLHVDVSGFEGALNFLKSVEFNNNDGGDASYGPAVHYGYQPGNEHGSSAHRLTAIGNLIKIFMGAPKEQVQTSVDWFVNKGGVPSWGANGEAVDMYYWYYGSLCTFQVGGDTWLRWNTGMMKALTENQCKQGDDAGSWPIVGEFSGEWGRVGQTALGCLSLEVYYRYKQMAQMKN